MHPLGSGYGLNQGQGQGYFNLFHLYPFIDTYFKTCVTLWRTLLSLVMKKFHDIESELHTNLICSLFKPASEHKVQKYFFISLFIYKLQTRYTIICTFLMYTINHSLSIHTLYMLRDWSPHTACGPWPEVILTMLNIALTSHSQLAATTVLSATITMTINQ